MALNLLGWVAYSTFNLAIYYIFECPPQRPSLGAPLGATSAATSDTQIALTSARSIFLGAGPRAADILTLGTTDFCQYAVEFNDVVFAVHALVLTLVTVAQCCIYTRGKQRVHGAVVATIIVVVAVAVAYASAILGKWHLGGVLQPWLEWVYWLYFLSYIKMGVTFVKYVPQVRSVPR